MGRPRALKTRDVVPAVDISKAGKGKKRVNFDEDEAVEEVAAAPQTTAAAADNDEPEEVKADSYEILRLKEELEASSSFTKNKKRKKAKKESDDSAADQLLDVSVLQSIGQDHATDTPLVEDKPTIEVIKADNKPVRSNKKILGKLEVSLLDDDHYNPLKSSVLPATVAEFDNQKMSGVQRTRYTTFMSQRRPNPAKNFKVKA